MEALVALLVLGIVTALVLGGVSGGRQAARRLACLANVRSCGLVIEAYTTDYREHYPLFASTMVEPAYYNAGAPLWYQSQSFFWPMATQDYAAANAISPTQLCPASPVAREVFGTGTGTYLLQYPDGWIHGSEYWLSQALFSDPALWRPGGAWTMPGMKRGVRMSEVLYPAVKGVLAELRAYHEPPDSTGAPRSLATSQDVVNVGVFSVSLADGHVGQFTRNALAPGFDPVTQTIGTPLLQTPDGCRGRDDSSGEARP